MQNRKYSGLPPSLPVCRQSTQPTQCLSPPRQFPLLVSAMQSHAQGVVVELLYVNNSTVERLTDFVFKNLKIINLQISNAGLLDVAPNAFRGLEDTLQNLNLAGNKLR